MDKNIETKTPVPGLDILKFCMAILVVAIHSEAVNAYTVLYELTWPVINSAVPEFFVVSSFLVFRKLRGSELPPPIQLKTLSHFTRRLCLLYLFWMVILFPFVLHARGYHHMSIYSIPFAWLKDVLLCSTFHGSWFLSALVVGVWLIWLCSKRQRDKTIWMIPLLISMYTYHYAALSLSFQVPWNWYADHIQNPQNSFPVSLLWIALGYILAKPGLLKHFPKKSVLGSMFLLSWAVTVWVLDLRPIMVVSLFALAYNWQIPYRPIYRLMRQSSILIFILHFVFISIFRLVWLDVSWLQSGPVLFTILVALCLVSSFVILRLKDYKYFSWLKYAY